MFIQRIWVALLYLMFFGSSYVNGQSDSLLVNVQFFSVEDGLSDRAVQFVLQDERGVIWAGTRNGLNKFYGDRFEPIYDPGNLLSYTYFTSMTSDGLGRYWLRPVRKESLLFDPFSGDIEVHESEHVLNGYYPLIPLGDTSFVFYYDGNSKPYRLNEEGRMLPLVHENDIPLFYPTLTPWGNLLNYCNTPYEVNEYDRQGNLIRILNEGKSHPRFYFTSRDKCMAATLPVLKDNVPLAEIISFYEGGSAPEPIRLQKDGKPLLTSDFDTENGLGLAYTRDSRGNQWLASQNSLLFFDPQGELLLDLSEQVSDKTPDSWAPLYMYIDQKDRLWFATPVGLFLVKIKKNPFQTYFTEESNSSLRGITELAQGEILASTHQGVRLINPSTKAIKTLRPKLLMLGLTHLSENEVVGGMHSYGLIYLKNRDLSSSYYELDRKTKLVAPYYHHSSNTLYIGAEAGLFYSTDRGETVKRYHLVNQFTDFNNHLINFIGNCQDEIWITGMNGAYRLEHGKGIVEHFSYNGLQFKHVYLDEAGVFWFATFGGGLLRWNRKTNDLQQFTTENGLSHDILYAVYEDNHHQLWLPSNNGLMRFDKTTHDVVTFHPEDGIAQEEFNTFSHFKSSTGHFYFGGINGLTAFHPDDIRISQDDFPFIITNFQRPDNSSGQLQDETLALLNDQKIVLQPDDKYFALSFALLDYTGTEKTYAWKIDGIDRDWNYQKENQLRINGLGYGNYTLHLRAKGNGGQWAKQEIIIPIVVQWPFYLRWPFILCCTVSFLGLTIGYVKHRTLQITRENNKLAQLVNDRTQELRLKNDELSQLNTNKDRLFAIISHDLRSPLISLRGITRKVNYLISNQRFRELDELNNSLETTVDHTKNLLDNLLNWALLQREGIPHRPETINSNEVIEAAVQLYQTIAEVKQVKLVTQIGEPVQLWCDRNAIATILRNLIDNAIKFSKAGQCVTICSAVHGNQFQVVVKDQGKGISKEQIDFIFANNSAKRNPLLNGQKSMGLGLLLCKELAASNGGTISVVSAPDQGCTFTVCLPIFASPKEVLPAVAEEETSK